MVSHRKQLHGIDQSSQTDKVPSYENAKDVDAHDICERRTFWKCVWNEQLANSHRVVRCGGVVDRRPSYVSFASPGRQTVLRGTCVLEAVDHVCSGGGGGW